MARRPKAADAEEPQGEGEAPKKRRGKPAAPGGNVSDQTIVEFYDKALNAARESEVAAKEAASKKGAYRAILKAAKNAGIPSGLIEWRLSLRDKDVADIDRETSWRNRIAKLTALPIGTQLGMFEDGTTVASAVDSAQVSEGAPTVDMLITADEQGYDAGKQGKSADATPFGDPASPLAIRWENARQKAQEEMVLAMGSGGAHSGVGASA